jgi:uncharacterized membrane protein YedE/YeeE
MRTELVILVGVSAGMLTAIFHRSWLASFQLWLKGHPLDAGMCVVGFMLAAILLAAYRAGQAQRKRLYGRD